MVSERQQPAHVLLLLAAGLLAGFAGGQAGKYVAALAATQQQQNVVRTSRGFELVGDDGVAGQAVSLWGVDEAEQVIMAFGSGGGRDLRTSENRLAVFGLQGNGFSPLLEMSGPDGKRPLILMLTQESKPALLMSDEGDFRLLLGIETSDTHELDDNNWTLLFLPERVRISMGTKKEGDRNMVWGYSEVNRERVPQRRQY